MENPDPNLYDLDFEDVYEIDFAVLDNQILEGVAKESPGPAPRVGELALATEILAAVREASEPEEVGTLDFYEIPAEMIDRVNTTVTTVLDSTTKKVIPIARFVDAAFGERVSKDVFRDFRNALDLDPRLEYLGSNEYLIKGREATDVYWPDENPLVDNEAIRSLVDGVVSAMDEARWTQFGEPQALGIAKGITGEYLTRDEINELLAQLSSHPRLIALESGGFIILKDPNEEEDLLKEERGIISLDFDREPQVRERPMTEKQVNKTLNRLRHSPEFKAVKEEAKRLANPRRRGRSKKGQTKKLMGRTHGKKESIDQLIAKLRESEGKKD